MEQPDNDIRIEHDENNYDLLICRRMECFFTPSVDGTPSADGYVLFHTEWQHFSMGRLRATSIGPQLRKEIATLLPGEYAGISGMNMLIALKNMFYQVSTSQLFPQDTPTDTGEAPNEAG